MVKRSFSVVSALDLALLFCACVPAVALAQSDAAREVAELRARKLYDRAHVHGLEQWRSESLSDRERAELAIQLAIVYTEHALYSPPVEREKLWSKADAICAAFIDGWPENPRRSLVETQRALVLLARGQQTREETFNMGDEDAAALVHLRAAARGLSTVATAVNEQLVELRLRPRTNASPDVLTVRELESLELNLALHLGGAQRQLGLCYPPRSADRDDALLQAVERLTPLAQRSPPDELAWKARVELVACQRELGRLQRAQDLLATWPSESMPSDIAPRLAAERVRLLAAAGQFTQAREAAKRATDIYADSGGELALAGLEAELAAWQHAARSGQAADSKRLTALAESIRERHGANFGRRAELLLGTTLAEASMRPSDIRDPPTILAAARHLYLTGRTGEAVASYERAGQMLDQRGQSNEAFSALMTAAAIEREAGRLATAGERYHRLALSARTHERAAEAHRLAILCAAKQLRQNASDTNESLVARYQQLLEEHLALWPDGPSSDELRLWLGQLLAEHGDWDNATRVLRRVSPASVQVHLESAPTETLIETLAAIDSAVFRPNTAPDVAKELGELAMEMVRQLEGRKADLDVRTRAALEMYRATALAAIGDRHGAANLLAQLAAQSPDNGDIQERYAQLLAGSESVSEQRQALAAWAAVEQRSRPGGDRWQRARRARIELLHRIGDREEADKLLRLTRLLYPDWERSESVMAEPAK